MFQGQSTVEVRWTGGIERRKLNKYIPVQIFNIRTNERDLPSTTRELPSPVSEYRMPYRTRTLEQLMRTILETQAAMLPPRTEMQQAVLSGMIPRKPGAARTQSEAIKPE